jgi:hypothetical protein
MHDRQQNNSRPELKEMVLEASRALAHLDAERLEELVVSCDALNREQIHADAESRVRWAREARGSRQEMALLASVLEATQANLRVLRQLSAIRSSRLEYALRAGKN